MHQLVPPVRTQIVAVPNRTIIGLEAPVRLPILLPPVLSSIVPLLRPMPAATNYTATRPRTVLRTSQVNLDARFFMIVDTLRDARRGDLR